MRLELEELEVRSAPSGIDLFGTIAQQASQVQQFVQQELSTIAQPNSSLGAELTLIRLRIAFEAIEPVVLAFAANGINAMGGDPSALAGFAGSLGQVNAALGLFSH